VVSSETKPFSSVGATFLDSYP